MVSSLRARRSRQSRSGSVAAAWRRAADGGRRRGEELARLPVRLRADLERDDPARAGRSWAQGRREGRRERLTPLRVPLERDGQKTTSGFVRADQGGRLGTRPDDVRVVVQLPQMPRYHEQVLLDELARKMRAEYGEPPEPRAPPPPVARRRAGRARRQRREPVEPAPGSSPRSPRRSPRSSRGEPETTATRD